MNAEDSDSIALVKSIYAEWEQGEFSNRDWADPDIEYVVPGPDPQVYRGLDEMSQAWNEWLSVWQDFSVTAGEIREVGDQIVVTQILRGKGRASGIPVDETQSAGVFKVRDGKVVRFAGYGSPEEALADIAGEG